MYSKTPTLVTRPLKRRVCLLAGLLLLGCGQERYQKQPDELLVGVLDDPVFYQPATTEREEGGFEYDLLQHFAESQHKKLRIVAAHNPSQLQELLDNAEIDFVASIPILALPDVRYTAPLREAKPLLVQHADSLPVYDPGALSGRVIEVLSGTAQEASLRQLPTTPPPLIEHPRATNGVDLLQRISEYHAELAATDSLHFDLALNYYPDLVVAQELPGKVAYAWGFRSTDEMLRVQADAFIAEAQKDGEVARLRDRYFGHFKRITPIGATQFIEDMRSLLPHYRPAFQEAQLLTGLDWRLIAALAYQESKWDPLATSYTGVRGMMMLTEETADRLDVDNRLDAAESIRAGAKYLAELKDRLPEKAMDPDRLWLALAAYNLGMGHLNGARQFALGMKRDPNSWYDMKKVLPLLAQPEYYERLKSGRARGGEAVILVENVRTYYDILVRFESPRRSPLQMGFAMQ
jgi:membrane-bound lytic murein transglycosylase F